jgi:hypothetical protein
MTEARPGVDSLLVVLFLTLRSPRSSFLNGVGSFDGLHLISVVVVAHRMSLHSH